MFNAARVRLAGWYMAILAVVIGLLSVALYRLLRQVQDDDLHSAHQNARHVLANVFAHDQVTLAYQIAGVDLALLVLALLGAYALAGRTLKPIEEAVDRQRRFASAASHELRTPLTALQGHVEVALLKQRTPPEYERILRGIADDIERMGQLVRSMLVLARPDRDATLAVSESVDLSDVGREAATALDRLATSGSRTFEVSLHQPLTVRGDPLLLRQVVLNLLDNAIAHTPEGGSIGIVGRRERGHAVLEVRDTGPGIARADLPHIFEPFYQADAARSDSGHIGLGLALAAWMVRVHGGKLEVVSHEGAGSTFTVSLPLAP
jgi:signal transduction histidine kinase